MKRTDPPIIVEQQFKASPPRLWNALTNPAEMRRWFFEQIPDFQPEIGFYTEFLIENEGRNFTHCWTVKEMIPERKLSLQWNYPEFIGDSLVHFEIEGNDAGSLLRVTTEVLEDYPGDIPEFSRESGVAGWKYFIQERLPQYLES